MNENFYPLFEEFLNKLRNGGTPLLEEERIPVIKLDDMDEVTSPYTGKVINVKKVKADMEAAKYKIVTQSALYRPYIHDMDPIIYTWVIPTMGTDGVRLFVNPEFAANLSWMGKIFVLIHEIMHCILMHPERGQGFDHKLFNIAGDLEINTIIVDTTADFDEKFVIDNDWLYDKKYLNVPVEQIYHDIMKNMPKLPPQPGPGDVKIDPTQKPKKGGTPPPPGPPQPPKKGQIEMKPGTKVRIKSTGKKGVIKSVNADGTFEIDPINEGFYPQLITESYKREEIVPILPKGSGSGGSGGGVNIEGEYEIEGEDKKEGKEGEGKGEGKEGKGKEGKSSGSSAGDKETAKKIAKQTGQMDTSGESTASDRAQDPKTGMTEEQRGLAKRMQNSDQGRAGGFLDTKTGEQIARASGYDDEEMRAGEEGRSKWESNAREMVKTAEKMKQAGSSRGDALINKLGKLLKGTVDWKSKLKVYIGSALSPETYYKIGAKKHLYKSSEYLKRGTRPKLDAMRKVVIAVDVSGSMWSGNIFEKVMAEANSIIFARKIKEITIIFFDDGVDPGSVQVIKPHGSTVWKPKNIKGGGGTDFQKPLDWIKSNYNDAINLCIFLTDGYAPNPRTPKYFNKFIWVIFDNFDYEAPFGKTIKLSVSDVT